ncbi:hypothetical protein J3A69_000716 [Pseudomonas putida]|nr:hypothetical protein [Pseudomonas sp. PvP089]MBP2086730.1 hypothetical protein [Pseudomonas sp. PvP088]MBP2221109.1 hypothetical protein [Pseudomonas putida]
MARYKFAHVREQGQDMIIVPVDSSFGSRSSSDQQEFVAAFEAAVNAAGLAGHAVAIWKSGNRVGFVAPPKWHPLFKSPGIWNMVAANINREITL